MRATFHDADGKSLRGPTVTGFVIAPADTRRHRRIALAETRPPADGGSRSIAILRRMALGERGDPLTKKLARMRGLAAWLRAA